MKIEQIAAFPGWVIRKCFWPNAIVWPAGRRPRTGRGRPQGAGNPPKTFRRASRAAFYSHILLIQNEKRPPTPRRASHAICHPHHLCTVLFGIHQMEMTHISSVLAPQSRTFRLEEISPDQLKSFRTFIDADPTACPRNHWEYEHCSMDDPKGNPK